MSAYVYTRCQQNYVKVGRFRKKRLKVTIGRSRLVERSQYLKNDNECDGSVPLLHCKLSGINTILDRARDKACVSSDTNTKDKYKRSLERYE